MLWVKYAYPKEAIRMKFAAKLKKLRVKAGYSQEDLAEKCGVSRQAVSKWESDTASPDNTNVLSLSRVFGVSIDYLMKDEIEDREDNSTDNAEAVYNFDEFLGCWCNIEVKGLDISHPNVGLCAETCEYLYFLQKEKRSQKYGLVRKEYVASVTKLSDKKQHANPTIEIEQVGLYEPLINRFQGKVCNIDIHSENLLGFIFETDGYQHVEVLSVSGDQMIVKDGTREALVPVSKISSIFES